MANDSYRNEQVVHGGASQSNRERTTQARWRGANDYRDVINAFL